MYVCVYTHTHTHTHTHKLQSDIQHDLTLVILVICSRFTVPDTSFCGLSYFYTFSSWSSLFQEHLIFSYGPSHYGWHHIHLSSPISNIFPMETFCLVSLNLSISYVIFSHLKHNRFLSVTLEIIVCHSNKLLRVFFVFSLKGQGLYLEVCWATLITICKFGICSIELNESLLSLFKMSSKTKWWDSKHNFNHAKYKDYKECTF